MLPQISVRAHGGLAPRPTVELAEAAERNGFHTLWFAENPFQRGVLPAAAASAAATRRINLGIGVFNPYNRHPTLMAMEMGALDELSEGRAVLGIGSGIGSAIERMGLQYAKPIGAVRDAIHIVRGMMRGESVTYDGSVFSAHGVKLEFSPRRADMPIYMAAVGDQGLAMCGKVADGLMVSNMCPPSYTRRARGRVAEGAAKAGRAAPRDVVQYVPCVLRSDRDAARAIAKTTVGGVLAAYWRLYEHQPAVRHALYRDSDISEDEFTSAITRMQGGGDAAQVLDDRFVDAYSIAGTANDCLQAAERFADAGVSELVLTFVGEDPAGAMQAFGRALGKRP